jgi:hypothetical protein
MVSTVSIVSGGAGLTAYLRGAILTMLTQTTFASFWLKIVMGGYPASGALR